MIVGWWAEDLNTGDFKEWDREADAAKFLRSPKGESYIYGSIQLIDGAECYVTIKGEYD